MKVNTMISGLSQMLGLIGDAETEVIIRVKNDDGEVLTYPLKNITFDSRDEKIVFTNDKQP